MAIDYALSLSLDAIRIAKAKGHLTTLSRDKRIFSARNSALDLASGCVDKLWITLKSRDENSKHADFGDSLRRRKALNAEAKVTEPPQPSHTPPMVPIKAPAHKP
jgi:hypothetical protein